MPVRSALRPADVAVTEPLELLVLAPPHAVEIRAQYHGPDGPVYVPSVWSPVTVVEPDRHDLGAGLVCPALIHGLVFPEGI